MTKRINSTRTKVKELSHFIDIPPFKENSFSTINYVKNTDIHVFLPIMLKSSQNHSII